MALLAGFLLWSTCLTQSDAAPGVSLLSLLNSPALASKASLPNLPAKVPFKPYSWRKRFCLPETDDESYSLGEPICFLGQLSITSCLHDGRFVHPFQTAPLALGLEQARPLRC
jgi:hypothetical protein